ncbi:MAG: hypothetical protein LBE99_04005 [Puniceicoccales bacterium]|jgi:hypothetical protein|nr:hypothetical protein [Puniceicoccales bacterium]
MQAKRQVIFFILLNVCLFAGMVAFNYIIDPFCIFHKPIFKKPIFLGHEVFMNLGQIETFLKKTDDYDTILLGTSHTENFLADEITQALKSKGTLKLCLSGGYPVELEAIVQKALTTGKVKNIVWGFELFQFILPAYTPHESRIFPYHLYKNKLPLLFDARVLRSSLKLLLLHYELKNIKFSWHYNNTLSSVYFYHNLPCIFDMHKRFVAPDTLKKSRDTRYHYDIFKCPNWDTTFSAIDTHLIPIIEAHPEIQFYIPIIPYSWIYFVSKGFENTEKIILCQRYLCKRASAFKNTRLYAFHTCQFPHNLANYYNETHYHPDINRYVLYAIQNNRHRLTMENLEQHEQAMIENLKAFEIKDAYPHMDSLEDIIRQEEAKSSPLDKPLLSHK